MANSKQLRRRRERLWRNNPRCHWCGTLTMLIREHLSQPVNNQATVDHLDDRFNPQRGKRPKEERTVLACWLCNQKRSRQRQKQFKHMLRLRSELGQLRKRLRKQRRMVNEHSTASHD